MAKIADFRYSICCSAYCSGSFRIRLYSGRRCPVIIATAPDRSDIVIDPQIDSYLAAEIAVRNRHILRADAAFVWIAHAPRDDFAQVMFAYREARPVVNHRTHGHWFGPPTKRAMTREEVAAMIWKPLSADMSPPAL